MELLVEAARAAGEVALGYVGQDLDVEHKPGGAGPVTDADHAVNAKLYDVLRKARPDYGWLSEESEDTPARMQTERTFIVDPIDGTRSFIEGSGSWAHSLAVVERGRAVAAAIFLPMKQKLYSAALGHGAFLNGQPIRASRRTRLSGASIVAAKPNYDASNWRGSCAPSRSHEGSVDHEQSQGLRYGATGTSARSSQWHAKDPVHGAFWLMPDP